LTRRGLRVRKVFIKLSPVGVVQPTRVISAGRS
jgi:hypothetical protein